MQNQGFVRKTYILQRNLHQPTAISRSIKEAEVTLIECIKSLVVLTVRNRRNMN